MILQYWALRGIACVLWCMDGSFASASRHNLEAAHQGNDDTSDFQKEILMNSVDLSQSEIGSDKPCGC